MLAWGSKVSGEFRYRVRLIAGAIGVDPSWLMAAMAHESGETFSASVRNAAGSGATGLIEFMPQTAAALGTSTDELAAMRPEDQLDYVGRYLFPYRRKLESLADLYMALFWPAAIKLPPHAVLFDHDDPHVPKLYLENKGFDLAPCGKITKAEAASGVTEKLNKGLQPPYVWAGA